MTAETLKPFIVPSAPNYPNQKRHASVFILIGLSVTFFVLVSTLLGYTIWNSIRVAQLEAEMTTLNRVIENMQKRLGLDYLDDLQEFEKVYKGESNSVNPSSSEEGDLLDNNFHDLEDYDEDDDDDELILDGSGDYDDTEKDDNYGNTDDDDIYDDFEKFKGSKKRKTRSISSTNGIPVYHDSYAIRRNKTGGPDDERILRHLLQRPSSPTLKYDWTDKSSKIEDDAQKQYETYPEKIVRVPQHNHHKIRNHIRRPEIGSNSVNRPRHHVRPALKSGKMRVKSLPMKTASPTVAVHYLLNGTFSGAHNYHPGHIKFPHGGDIYIGSPHTWARQQGSDKFFDVNHGVITIKESGVYMIYAQIFYDNKYDKNGYKIFHNEDAFLRCSINVPLDIVKSNTCYTNGVIYLEAGDSVHLRDLNRDRYVDLREGRSFIGLIKLGDGV